MSDLTITVKGSSWARVTRERDEARAERDILRSNKMSDPLLARDEINIIRNTLSKNGEAVGNGEHDFSIIEMIENLMQSRDYFIRKSDSLECERDEAREELEILRSNKMSDPLLATTFKHLKAERDEARDALQRITESDMRWSKKIARDALEAAK